jgi:hypothetical protein
MCKKKCQVKIVFRYRVFYILQVKQMQIYMQNISRNNKIFSSFKNKYLCFVALLSVHLEKIVRTVLRLSCAKFWQVALVVGRATLGSSPLGSAGVQITTLACCAGGIEVQHAGGGIAARVVALLGQSAVTLLSGLNKVVAANRAVKQSAKRHGLVLIEAGFLFTYFSGLFLRQ